MTLRNVSSRRKTHWSRSELDRLVQKRASVTKRYAWLQNARGLSVFRRISELEALLGDAVEVILITAELSYFTGEHEIIEEVLHQVSDPANTNKRWSDAEDETIIEQACKGVPPVLIGHQLHRSPAAVATRISQLVGIKRLFINVDGRIVGSLEGDDVDGHFTGVLQKEASK